ncbi:hypothetical protein [Photobacterium sp. Hal280]|uniref:hypothetical protein n=1 Tax=Photobacterium sp. Hal280 TaxID=3035163 RepID=UPI00301E3BE7
MTIIPTAMDVSEAAQKTKAAIAKACLGTYQWLSLWFLYGMEETPDKPEACLKMREMI